MDAKIICVPNDKICPLYTGVHEASDLSTSVLQEIEFFFARYKDVQDGKWSKVHGIKGSKEAKEEILKSIK